MESPLLSPEDPAPFQVLNPEGQAALLLVCDHAASAVPRRLGGLGLPGSELERHIGWDIGAGAVTAALAERLDARAIVTSFSRLVIDCNRHLHDPTLIAAESDGTVVPGNAALDAGARAARIDAIYRPYHQAIGEALDDLANRGLTPALVSLHSFTPRMGGRDRPWHLGVLWDRDDRLAAPLLRVLSARPGLVVGDNEPYSAQSPIDFTVPLHSGPRNLPHVTFELRQNEIDSDEGVARYADLLAEVLAPILAAVAPSRSPP